MIWECVSFEAGANFESDYCRVERLDYPLPIPVWGRYYAYLRKEGDAQEQRKHLPKKVPITGTTTGYALLAAQYALLGIVTPELRAVLIDFDQENNLLRIRFYHNGEIAQELKSLWQAAISQIHEDFSPHSLLDGCIKRVNSPKKIPFLGNTAWYAYCRKEERL